VLSGTSGISRLAAVIGSAAGLFAVITLFALEGNEVVVVRTRAAAGDLRETRTWIADEGGAAFIEAAHAERPFYQHLVEVPDVEVVRAGRIRRYRAVPVPNPGGHAHIRALLAAKYGWADTWIGLLQDTSQSIEVRLEPAE
jgi:hypothetical protein